MLERWTFLTQKEQKWLSEVITEILDELAKLGVVRAHRLTVSWCGERLAATRALLTRFFTRLAAVRMSKPESQKEQVQPNMPPSNAAANANAAPRTSAPPRMSSISMGECPRPVHADGRRHNPDTHLLLDVRDPRVRFQNAVRAVIKLQRTTGKQAKPLRPGMHRHNSWWQTQPETSAGPESCASPVPDRGVWPVRRGKMTEAIEELKALELTQELSPHGALVRHIQFSPNGRYFATAR